MKTVTFPSLRRQVDMNMSVRLRIGKGKKENHCLHCESDAASPSCILICSL